MSSESGDSKPVLVADGGFDPAADAAAAAREAEKRAEYMPDIVLVGTRLGKCPECGETFPYGQIHHETGNMGPCPECGSYDWEKWGYRHDGEDVPKEEIEW